MTQKQKQEFITDPVILVKISDLAAKGFGVKDIARQIGLTERELNSLSEKLPVVKQALSDKEFSDRMVENALLKRAIGYTNNEITRQLNKDGTIEIVKIVEKNVMPSTTAQIFWLKNRCGYIWDGQTEDEDEDEAGVVVLPACGEIK